MRRFGVVPALALLLACPVSQTERINCDCVTGDCVPTDAAPAGEEVTAKMGLTGGPCEVDADCVAGQCLTTAFLQSLNPKLEAPGGMCSKLGCAEDAECGPEAGCVDASSVASVPLKLCMRFCSDSSDCRYSGGYGCFDTQVKDANGKAILACLPNALVVAINCGDGTCDMNEAATGSCPEDCK